MAASIHGRQHQLLRSMLIAERQKRRLTQHELAKSLRRPQSYVSKYETGERQLSVIDFLEIAAAVGFDPRRFIRRLQNQME